jgi:AcrR family transcriptional regulator
MKSRNYQKTVGTQIKNSELVRGKRLQIAKVASKLFIKKGYFSTTMREISKASGLTIGNLYDYITKKEDVLYLVFDVFHSIWVNRLEEKGVFEIEDPVKQLKTAIQRMLELTNEHRDMVLLMYTESKSLPKDFLKIILEKESGLVQCFEKILNRGIGKGVFNIKDPFLLANIIVYLLSIEPLRGWNFKRYKIEEIDDFIEEFILGVVSDGL